jgi:hypothetical protein
MRWAYTIQVPLELPDRWHDLCRCCEAEQAAEIVRVLLATHDPRLSVIRVTSTEEPYGP